MAIETPLDPAPNLSARVHNPIFLKREDMQPVFSFKLRGATTRWPPQPGGAQARVICASAGNHAQGVAAVGKRLGTRAVIVMPTTTRRSRSTRSSATAASGAGRRELFRRLRHAIELKTRA